MTNEIGESQIYYLESFQTILFNHYTNTKKILLSTERFADYSNYEVFYNMFGALDELYLIMTQPDNDLNNIRCRRIEAYLLVAQIYSILSSIPEIHKMIKKFYPKMEKQILGNIRDIREVLFKYRIIKKNRKTNEYNFYVIKNIYNAAKNINRLRLAAKKLVNIYHIQAGGGWN